ncbi:hypothetical protein [Rhodococcoides fascians]|uniref:hypothetical protein n=1 Tax=Rhodococcoides fascians TaxID=1828 RepID=UPI00052306B1|nr:hypothetical protein [Rhodococcus fascians]
MQNQQWTEQPRQQNMETAQMAAIAAEQDRKRDNLTGVWMAFYDDSCGTAIATPFRDEIDALRCAVQSPHDLRVEFVAYGTDVFA